jgi:alkylation response protein AidB-like acyl-CoA dehydrogenase
MNAAGLTVVPTRMIDGDAEENELIFDGVEVGPDALVGQRDAGFSVVTTNMNFARGIGTIERTLWLELTLACLRRTAATLASDGAGVLADSVRHRLANLHARVQALKYLGYRKISEMEEMGDPGPNASVEKLVWAETSQAVTTLAMEILGPRGLVEDAAPSEGSWSGRWAKEYFRAKGCAIEGGTNEIQKNIIAKRVLRVTSA